MKKSYLPPLSYKKPEATEAIRVQCALTIRRLLKKVGGLQDASILSDVLVDLNTIARKYGG